MRITFKYGLISYVFTNCPQKLTELWTKLDELYHHALPEGWTLISKDIWKNSFLIADQEDFDEFKKELQTGFAAFAVTATLPTNQYRYKDRKQYYRDRFNAITRGNVEQKDLNGLIKDKDNEAEMFKKDLSEAALAQEEDTAKVDQYSDTPSNIHYYTNCNGCQASPIVGVRFKCTVCPDFNFCEECEQTKDHSHNFVQMKECDDFDAFKYKLKQKKLSVRSVEWMKFDPDADSLVQELFNVRKNASKNKYEENGSKDNFISKDEMKPFYLYQTNEEKKHAPSLEDIERTEIDEKIAGLLEYFPNEDFNMISSFVLQAPSNMSFIELKENYRNNISLRWSRALGIDPTKPNKERAFPI